MAGSVSWCRVPDVVTSKASTTIRAFCEAAFCRPVPSIVNVWRVSAKPVAVKTAAWNCSVAEYRSISATKTPSRDTRATPLCVPRAPIQLTAVPVKVNVACAPGVVDTRAAPALHALSEAPWVRPVERRGRAGVDDAGRASHVHFHGHGGQLDRRSWNTERNRPRIPRWRLRRRERPVFGHGTVPGGRLHGNGLGRHAPYVDDRRDRPAKRGLAKCSDRGGCLRRDDVGH